MNAKNREKLIEMMARAEMGSRNWYEGNKSVGWDDVTQGTRNTYLTGARAALDAALSSGLCVLVDDLEQAGALIHEGYADSPMPFYVFHALPGKGVEPLYRRLPVLIAEEEKP